MRWKMQKKQSEWYKQWKMLSDNELFLFKEWIQPYQMETFKGKTVLECGCGGGQHTSFVAAQAKSVTAVDLNTVEIARKRNSNFSNVSFVEGDIATMNLGVKFDIVISIGVVHHTDSQERTVQNLKRHLKPGGLLILWVYSKEGNWLVEKFVEPIRKAYLITLSRQKLLFLSKWITFFIYFPVFSIYLLPLYFLPFFEYFGNFRKLSFERNVLNIFDKLNAPQVDFVSFDRALGWVADMDEGRVLPYKGVSFNISGKMR